MRLLDRRSCRKKPLHVSELASEVGFGRQLGGGGLSPGEEFIDERRSLLAQFHTLGQRSKPSASLHSVEAGISLGFTLTTI